MSFPTQGQSSYSVKLTQAVAGMWADDYEDLDVVSYKATENMGFGLAVEIDLSNDSAGFSVRLPKSTSSTLAAIVGVTMYVGTIAQALAPSTNVGFASGMLVPICRKGRMYCSLHNTGSNAVTPFANPAINHASDTTGSPDQTPFRGSFSSDTVSTVAGIECTAAPSGFRFIRDISTSGVCLLDILLPQGTSGS